MTNPIAARIRARRAERLDGIRSLRLYQTTALATRARRARMDATLQQLRRIGAQLDALDTTHDEAADVIEGARIVIGQIREDVEFRERVNLARQLSQRLGHPVTVEITR